LHASKKYNQHYGEQKSQEQDGWEERIQRSIQVTELLEMLMFVLKKKKKNNKEEMALAMEMWTKLLVVNHVLPWLTKIKKKKVDWLVVKHHLDHSMSPDSDKCKCRSCPFYHFSDPLFCQMNGSVTCLLNTGEQWHLWNTPAVFYPFASKFDMIFWWYINCDTNILPKNLQLAVALLQQTKQWSFL